MGNPVIQSNLCTAAILGTSKKWPLSTGGRYSEVYKNGKKILKILVLRTLISDDTFVCKPDYFHSVIKA
jgi:hypothetical protein